MQTLNKKPKIIAIGGISRSGKDLFCKIAAKILEKNGKKVFKLAFADELKNDLDPFLKEKYGISAWTENPEEKTIIRPLLVAHGCSKRLQTGGVYWIDKLQLKLNWITTGSPDGNSFNVINQDDVPDYVFISDVRFPNESDWVQNDLKGIFIHISKFSWRFSQVDHVNMMTIQSGPKCKYFNEPPNDEEKFNNPLIMAKADYRLEWEDKNTDNKKTPGEMLNDMYLEEQVTISLEKCLGLSKNVM